MYHNSFLDQRSLLKYKMYVLTFSVFDWDVCIDTHWKSMMWILSILLWMVGTKMCLKKIYLYLRHLCKYYFFWSPLCAKPNFEILKITTYIICSFPFCFLFYSDDVVQMCVDYLREYPLLCGLMIGLPIILFIAFIYLTASSPEKPKSKKTKKKKSEKDQ